MWATRVNFFGDSTMPPPRPKEKRPTWGFRVPPDLESFLGPHKKGDRRGSGLFTAIVVRMLRLTMHVIEEAGNDYQSVVLDYAEANSITEGQALWRLARKGHEALALEAAKAKKPKK